jgi:hypothetical protein
MSLAADRYARVRRRIPRRALGVAKALYWQGLSSSGKRALIASRFRAQADWCERLGSPLYAHLLRCAAQDVEGRGPTWAAINRRQLAPVGADEAIPLSFMAGVHRLVLEGRAPELARHYPSAGGAATHDPWPSFVEVVSEHIGDLRDAMERPVQTNEPARSAALLGGFLLAGRRTAGRLRLLELGASAGLNLRWDLYRYEAGDAAWGDPESPVRLDDCYVGGTPPLHLPARVLERAGCDLNPLDPASDSDRLTLRSLVWPDQENRRAMLEAALDVAQTTPACVDREDAAEWLAAQLERQATGVTTVVFHSFFEQYPDEATRQRLRKTLRSAGARATQDAPVAYMRMEWGRNGADIELTTWPGYRRALIASADNQGRNVRWLGEAGD